MLKFLSRRSRSRQILLIGFVALMALALIGVFSPSFFGIGEGISSDTTIARVGRYDITLKELRDSLSFRAQQVAQDQATARVLDSASIYAMFGDQILSDLIKRKVIVYEADQLNIRATDDEVRERLQRLISPWQGAAQYREQLRQIGMTPVEFENQIRESIVEEKLRSFVTAGVQVSLKEIEEEYRKNAANYSVRWVEVAPSMLVDRIQFTESDLLAYFEQNRGAFRVNEEQRQARYIFIDQTVSGEAVQVSDDDLRADFDPEVGVQEVRVSQIVLNIPPAPPAREGASEKPPQPEEEVRKRAEEIVRKAQGDDSNPPEDFGALANRHSQDAASRVAGGDIGWVHRRDHGEADDPLNRVFTMQKDSVSQPIRKGDQFYIFKVTDRKVPTFEDARAQLLKEAQVRRAYSKAVEISTDTAQRLRRSRDPEAVASEINQTYGDGIATVRETRFFTRTESITGLGFGSEFAAAVFNLQSVNDVTDRLNVDGGFAIAQFVERRDPHDPPFEDVRARVQDSYRNAKARDLALERAREMARQAQNPDSLKRIADSMGLRTEERAGISGVGSIGPLVSEMSRNKVYALEPNEVTREPIKGDNSDSHVVAAMLSKTEPDMGEAFNQERKSIEERLISARREMIFGTFLNDAQRRLKDTGKIRIYDDRIARAIGEPTLPEGISPQRSGGLPATPPMPQRQQPRRTPQGAVPPIR